MKPRRVFVELELETDLSRKVLRNKNWWQDVIALKVHQVTVNVAQKLVPTSDLIPDPPGVVFRAKDLKIRNRKAKRRSKKP